MSSCIALSEGAGVGASIVRRSGGWSRVCVGERVGGIEVYNSESEVKAFLRL